MIQDTRQLNADRSDIESLDEIWLFGYGSLIYKVDFPFIESRPAYIYGWQRRFWQGSHDHRGTPERPGRVLTLIEAPDERCFGVAFRITPAEFDHLDHREKNGYLRKLESLEFMDGKRKPGVLYIGPPDNAAFLGDASDIEIATQIFRSEGPSGKNADYVHALAQALRDFGEVDLHVQRIDELLRQLSAEAPTT